MFNSHFFGSNAASTSEYLRTIERMAHALIGALPGGPYSGRTPAQLRTLLQGPIAPQRGCAIEEAFERLKAVIENSAAVWHPCVAAHLHTPVLNAALAAELVISALNQSMDSFDQAPAATVIEQQTIAWLCRLANLPPTASGTFTAGGTQSNYMGLLLARDHFLERRRQWNVRTMGLPPVSGQLRILCSEAAHFSVEKAAIQLGLGTQSVVRIPVNEEFRMYVPALEERVTQLREQGLEPMAVVATAGTTDFGSIDAIAEIADLAHRADLWLHVDAAYGGALLLSEKRDRLAGIGQATSVAVDFHKAFFQPISCAAFLVADETHFGHIRVYADYLNPESRQTAGIPDLVNNSVLTSRRFDALKLWLSLNTVGVREFGRMIDRLLELASKAAAIIDANACFELLHKPELGCVVFRYAPNDERGAIDEINRSIVRRLFDGGEAVLGQTVVAGQAFLKMTISNPCMPVSEISTLVKRIAEVGRMVESEASAQVCP